jgi:hypothetical protein
VSPDRDVRRSWNRSTSGRRPSSISASGGTARSAVVSGRHSSAQRVPGGGRCTVEPVDVWPWCGCSPGRGRVIMRFSSGCGYGGLRRAAGCDSRHEWPCRSARRPLCTESGQEHEAAWHGGASGGEVAAETAERPAGDEPDAERLRAMTSSRSNRSRPFGPSGMRPPRSAPGGHRGRHRAGRDGGQPQPTRRSGKTTVASSSTTRTVTDGEDSPERAR